MNERIIKLGLESGMLNYVDHETPRHYFLCGYADEKDLEKFAELIVRECASVVAEHFDSSEPWITPKTLLYHFGVEE